MAHSFGGYIAGNYVLKYHQHVKKLILLSAIGMKKTKAADHGIMQAIDGPGDDQAN